MICKAPNDNYKYTVDWSAEIGADAISGSTWTLETGIVNDGDTFTDSTTTVDVSSGVAGEFYELVNNITTAGGDVYEKRLYLEVKELLV